MHHDEGGNRQVSGDWQVERQVVHSPDAEHVGAEPKKVMCWLTDMGDSDEDHTANLFLKASLAGIDNFLQRVRRSLNPLERPLLTASKNLRIWYDYSPYNPVMVEQLLDVYRVMHNFVDVGKEGKTPVMRLGLAKAVYAPEEALYFTP